MSRQVEVAVVGAGPAGLSAALEARRLGAEVLVLDEYDTPGGQYMKQLAVAASPGDDRARSPQVRDGAALIAAAAAAGVEIWSGAKVWGLFPGRRLGIERDGRGFEITAERLIVASGAHDRSLAFPGWTLPGVMTPGCAQTLAKAHGVLPGRRVVVAGSGPFLLVVAHQLARAGAEIVAYVEAAPWSWAACAGLARFPGCWRELARYAGALAARRVPVHLGCAVTAADGGDALEQVTIARLDGTGRPSGGGFTVKADALAVAYGFRPSTELTALAGCAHGFDEALGGRYCVADPDTGVTSAPQVYAAGEVTGIGGAQVALGEGRIAGLSAARSLGRWDVEAELRLPRVRRRLRRARRFAAFVNRTFAVPPGLTGLVTADTVLCRCEEVRADAVAAAVSEGARTLGAVEMWTRLGMGPCQGRMCGWSAGRYVAMLSGADPAAVGVNEPRIPIKPVPLECVLKGAEEAA